MDCLSTPNPQSFLVSNHHHHHYYPSLSPPPATPSHHHTTYYITTTTTVPMSQIPTKISATNLSRAICVCFVFLTWMKNQGHVSLGTKAGGWWASSVMLFAPFMWDPWLSLSSLVAVYLNSHTGNPLASPSHPQLPCSEASGDSMKKTMPLVCLSFTQ